MQNFLVISISNKYLKKFFRSQIRGAQIVKFSRANLLKTLIILHLFVGMYKNNEPDTLKSKKKLKNKTA